MSPDPAGRPIEFGLLGPFEARCHGRRLDVGAGKQRALLAILVLRMNRVVSRDTLVEELWGESPPLSAVTTLHSLVSRVRRAVAPAGEGGAGLALRAREPGYVLEGDPGCADIHCFEQLVGRARDELGRGEPDLGAQSLRRALDVWRGDALADLRDFQFTRAAASRIEELRLTTVEDLAEAELACGRPSDATALLEPHVAAKESR